MDSSQAAADGHTGYGVTHSDFELVNSAKNVCMIRYHKGSNKHFLNKIGLIFDSPFAVLTVSKRDAKNLYNPRSSTSGVKSPTQIEQSLSPGTRRVL